jgi:hypothetical protein
MSQPPNQKKYDLLLNQFLKKDNLLGESESEQMKLWLEEAASELRSEFRYHRGEITYKIVFIAVKYNCLGIDGKHDTVANQDKKSSKYADQMETAMCVSLPSDSSDEESNKEKVVIFLFFQ